MSSGWWTAWTRMTSVISDYNVGWIAIIIVIVVSLALHSKVYVWIPSISSVII